MKLIRGLHNLHSGHQGSALTIGNFDGLHLGHRAVLEQLQQHATERKLLTTVMVFEPTPQEYFAPQSAPARLQRLRDKLVGLRKLGVDQVLCLRFNCELAELSAAAFVERILVQGLGVRYLVVGDDFRFGRDRAGDFGFLQAAGRQAGFDVVSTSTFDHGDKRISSSRIRQALAVGDLEGATQMLGRPYHICGRVAPGQQRGRTMGFHTANIRLHRAVSPVKGVFAVQVSGLGDTPLPGVANLGTRPTVDGSYFVLEVHLFDFDADIYGRYLDVELCRKLRDEKKFESFEYLKKQIEADAFEARAFFSE
ncbi:FMN adenylyltransferase / Riboflavin kinase [hydrothermal vent metagenome]|uniref:Bifunctional riboflavin kinase/FMN adenylyltransferase n=1 Tax=hydrothermal vent metagenome TaxID=652676 RepID=A0A3B0Z8Z5_9ZZZZ